MLNHSSMFRTSLTAALVASLMLGCASSTKETRKSRITDKLVYMRILKAPPTKGGSCPVTIRITNRMRDTTWDRVSYHLAFTNGKNITIGKLIGIPRHLTKSGQHIDDMGKVSGARCEDIAGVSVIYFGYNPPGKGQVSLHLSHVGAEIR